MLRLGGGHPDSGAGMPGFEILKIDITSDIQMLPVIHAGTFNGLFVKLEAKRLD